MTVTTYDIQELVNASGVPRRTVYFYVQQGILPPPEGAGQAARYTEAHLLRLRLIPILRQQGLRLDEIRARFGEMSVEAMREALAGQPVIQSLQILPGSPANGAGGRRVADRTAQIIPQPVSNGERYIHYPLASGVELVAPENLGPGDRQRLQLLLQAARQIFTTGTVFYRDAGQTPATAEGPAGRASDAPDEPAQSPEE